MNLSVLDQLIVVAYLAAIMGIGFAMKRRASKECLPTFGRQTTSLVGAGNVRLEFLL